MVLEIVTPEGFHITTFREHNDSGFIVESFSVVHCGQRAHNGNANGETLQDQQGL